MKRQKNKWYIVPFTVLLIVLPLLLPLPSSQAGSGNNNNSCTAATCALFLRPQWYTSARVVPNFCTSIFGNNNSAPWASSLVHHMRYEVYASWECDYDYATNLTSGNRFGGSSIHALCQNVGSTPSAWWDVKYVTDGKYEVSVTLETGCLYDFNQDWYKSEFSTFDVRYYGEVLCSSSYNVNGLRLDWNIDTQCF